jgi:hypothetical protein
VKQTRCTTCDADHEYKHAKVPRQRRKDAPAALQSPVAGAAPKRIAHEAPETPDAGPDHGEPGSEPTAPAAAAANGVRPASPAVQKTDTVAAASGSAAASGPASAEGPASAGQESGSEADEPEDDRPAEEGPAHRRLIRATLPRIEGQAPPARPGPDFTIRQPNNGRQRFRNPRGMSFHHNRPGNTGGDSMSRQGGRRPPTASRQAPRHGPQQGGGRKRSK